MLYPIELRAPTSRQPPKRRGVARIAAIAKPSLAAFSQTRKLPGLRKPVKLIALATARNVRPRSRSSISISVSETELADRCAFWSFNLSDQQQNGDDPDRSGDAENDRVILLCLASSSRNLSHPHLPLGMQRAQPRRWKAEPNALEETQKKQREIRAAEMGGTRLELVTSTMSTWRSNQLS